MAQSKTPFLLLLVAFMATTLPLIQSTTNPIFRDFYCLERSGNYSLNSPFHNNLNQLLSDLSTNSSLSSSYSTNSSNQVSGQYYCRHDLSIRICRSCVHSAATQITSSCPSSREAIVWFDECTLLYHNYSATVDYNGITPAPFLSWYVPQNVVTNPAEFYPVLADTMDRIVNESAYGGVGFATGEGKVSAVETVYSLAQCSSFINGSSCEKCLRKGLLKVNSCCKDYYQLEYFTVNCQFRYSLSSFYTVNYSPPPPPVKTPSPPAPAPALNASTPSDPARSGNGGAIRSSGSFKIRVVMAFATFVLVSLWGRL